MPEINTDLLPVDVPPPAPGPTLEPGKSISADEAGNAIAAWRQKAAEQAAKGATAETTDKQPRVNGRFASTQTESTAKADDAAPPQEATGETDETDPAQTPPLDLPRSWSKDKAEIWNGLPRETQEYLLEHDKTTSAEVRRSQNDTADRTKALDAKMQEAEQARQQHEQAANRSLQVLQSAFMRDFADIKSQDDVQRLAREDPFRWAQFSAQRDAIAVQANEVQSLNQQRETEQKAKFETWSRQQDEAFDAKFKEFKDPEKGPKLRESLKNYLVKDVGVPAEALPGLWSNELFRDSMMQEIIYDAFRFRQARNEATSKVGRQPTPPVLRPGTSSSKGDQISEQIADAQKRLSNSRGIASATAAADLMRLKRQAGARR